MIRVTYGGVMSHMNESCHIWKSHVEYEGVVSHMNETCHIVSHMNASCHTWLSRNTYEWFKSHMNDRTSYFCGAYERVMSHVNGSCHAWTVLIYKWVMPRMNESCTNEQIEKITSTNQGEEKRTNATDPPECTLSVHSSSEFAVEETSILQFPLKMVHLWNTPNRKTQILRYLAAQIQIEKWIEFKLRSGLV